MLRMLQLLWCCGIVSSHVPLPFLPWLPLPLCRQSKGRRAAKAAHCATFFFVFQECNELRICVSVSECSCSAMFNLCSFGTM